MTRREAGMDIAWTRLIGVRERQRHVAQQDVARQRRAHEAGEQHAQAAHGRWLQQVQTQVAHWQATAARSAAGGLNAQQLRDAATGSRALDAQIARASQAAAQARAEAAAQQARLQASRSALRAADGALLKARTMHERHQAVQRKAGEQRQEAQAEESSARSWQKNQSNPHHSPSCISGKGQG